MEQVVRNAIAKGIATEDVSKVESIEHANDKNLSEVSRSD